jgi:ubiquinone/menaquinone biosynthesis C-methylase UbiE
MRDPFGLNERLFAAVYPKVIERSEKAGQRETRRRLIADAAGDTVEVGAGSGINLPHYTDRVTELTITEPSPYMLAHLRDALDGDPPAARSHRLVPASAQSLPFADASFDTAVCTFMMCSVSDPSEVLDEIARVLKPGGRLLFLEHVRAEEGTTLGRFQDLIELPHRYLAAGCYPNRRTARLIEQSRLEIEWLEHGEQPRSLPSVRPTIMGAAVSVS